MQVRSPADILPGILMDLANLTEINTAAVLYDDTFSKLRNRLIYSQSEEHFSPFAVSYWDFEMSSLLRDDVDQSYR